MGNSLPLSQWDSAVAAYLTSRRALGRLYFAEEYVLHRVGTFLARAGAKDLTDVLFDRWRYRSTRLSTSTRLREERTVYKFCLYRRRTERRCFLPDPRSFVRLKPYPLPIIVGREQVGRLLAACASRPYRRHLALHQAVMRMAVVLLYTAGLRRGEVIRLTLGDVDAATGVLRIRDSKFHKSRWVPLSHSTTLQLRAYLRARRRAGFDQGRDAPLLTTMAGRPYGGSVFTNRFHALCARAGVRGDNGRCPRVHDMRHSFAVGALLRWYEADADVQTNLPRLAMYMGHVSIASTAYYLRLMPAVIERASERFARSCADLLQEGTP